jgi:STE24 endopeptidase
MNADWSTAGFKPEDVAEARRYRRPLYGVWVVETALGAAVLGALATARLGDWLYRPLQEAPWWATAPVFAALVLACSALVQLPPRYWAGFVRERRFRLSTQTLHGWGADYAKGLGIGLAIGAVVELGLVGLARAAPRLWPLWAAVALAAAMPVLTLLAPVLIEPLFNRFRPLADETLAEELRGLADDAGVPVRTILVADASRRTTKANAYVSGLGPSRRLVVYDTLLERTSAAELSVVVAHELAHRRERHVLKGTLLGMAAAVVTVLVVWAVLGDRAADPRNSPLVFLLGLALELAALAPGNGLSRRWERTADRLSLAFTSDLDAYERVHRELARSNRADLTPSRAVYTVLFSHPTAPERILLARAWARTAARSTLLAGRP